MAKKKSKSSGKGSKQRSGAVQANANDPVTKGGGSSDRSAPAKPEKRQANVTAQVRGSRKRRQQRVNVAIGAGIATVVVAAIASQVIIEANRPGEKFASLGNVHLLSLNSPHVPYNTDPPTSGPHMPSLAPWGSHLEPLPDEYVVHNMEDAGVVLWYDYGTPEENAERVAALEAISRDWRRIIIVPRENLGSQYVLTAWQRLQRFDDIDEEAMRRFIDAYEGIDHHPR